MSCNCSEFSGKLTLINSKIDALLKENTALKTKLKKKADFSQLNRVESNINSRNNPFFEKVDNGLDILGQRIKDLVIKDNQDLEKQFKREAAYATKSDIARLERRLSSVEAFIRESEKDKESGLFATKAELEKLRREAATKDYVDQKDNALKRSLEKLIDNAEDDINGLRKELSAEVRERKRLINQIKSTAESAKTTAEKALEEARKKKEAVDNFARTQIAKLEAKVSALAFKVAANTAKIAGLAAAVALIKKTLAGVSLVLAKLTPLLALVGTIVSVFGAGFSIASFYQTSNRINKLEAKVLSLGNEISKILGKFITPLVARVRRLENQDNVTDQELSRGLASLGASLNSRLNQISGVANLAQAKADANALKVNIINGIVGATSAIFTAKIINTVANRFPNIGRQPVVNNNNTTNITNVTNNYDQRKVINNTTTQNTNIDYGRIESINRKYSTSSTQMTQAVTNATSKNNSSNHLITTVFK
ncbi:hypothetical protein Lepto7376_2383 [[Leptolyngbya] sp. PCC 7376]|uniref:hypothetical protein n=1 Tax=[Leptolyngbya] sp. PCC 7376 TaxID=111781 RepID=UPI00029EF9FC|nr:hypothetical protein [[Leptolyngbya] sp. PCC 7376]AFY38665.1 hypothetical protein Lepto7376_2383 [[Leptolyngbya] sp. PCC 7376]